MKDRSTGPLYLAARRRWWQRGRSGLPVPPTFPDLEPETDGAVAAWLDKRLSPMKPWPFPITALVPEGFEACARILHPAFDGGGGFVPWTVVADWSGRPLEPTSFFGDIGTRGDGTRWPGGAPMQGELSESECAVIAEVASGFTSTPDQCHFGIWIGYGDVQAFTKRVPAIGFGPHTGGDECVFLRGAVRDVTALQFYGHLRPPNWWWPDDRVWLIASQVDAWSTYVGGPAGLIERLLETDGLEVMPASPTDPFDGCHHGQVDWFA
jgi:hypothetical protein